MAHSRECFISEGRCSSKGVGLSAIMAAQIAGCDRIFAVDVKQRRLSAVSWVDQKVTLDVNSLLFGRTVRGIIEGDSVADVFIPQLIELYRQGRFPFNKLITYYDLADINQAAADSESGAVIKPVLRMPA